LYFIQKTYPGLRLLRAPLVLRAGLRRKEGILFVRYPALIPQRASAPSETYRAIIGASLAGLGVLWVKAFVLFLASSAG
jgi:hypothetical protein